MKTLKTILAITLILFFASCSKNDDAVPTNDSEQVYPPYVYTANVYVAGGTNNTATVWKNGVPTPLSNGTMATCVFVTGNDVYVGGRQKVTGAPTKGKIWKNGVETILSAGYYNVMVNSIFVSGNDVYACGFVQNSGGGQSACYWKNGTLKLLSNTQGFSAEDSATGICVLGNTVYVSGNESNNSFYLIAKVWKIVDVNTPVATTLSVTGIDTYTTGITVNGTNVYVSAYEKINNKTIPVYFTNLTKTALPYRTNTDGWANGIALNSGNIYVSGYDTNNLASSNSYFWKDGVTTNLTSPTTEFSSRDHSWAPTGISVLNGSVFQSADDGYLGNFNAMFLDGSRPVYLTNSESIYSFAKGIFVTPL